MWSPTGKIVGMRPSRSFPVLRPRSAAPGLCGITPPDGASTIDAVDRASASKSGSKILSPDIPPWATAEVSRGCRRSSTPRERLDQFDSPTGRLSIRHAASVLSKQRAAAGGASRLEPLLTVAETAAILNVSVRTVRRLIGSSSISAIRIGRSVRLRSRDIEQLIAAGGDCDD